MKYYSTRDTNNIVSAAYAIASGLAIDGGLFVPMSIPEVNDEIIMALCKMDYAARAVKIMGMYLDEEFSELELREFASNAYSSNFDCNEVAPIHFINEKTGFLELWHGPTCAFKDMALQMLPWLLSTSLKKLGERRRVCILTATSGDTGKAALEGFADVKGTSIIVFYPKNGVSEIQKLQMTTQRGDNLLVCAVDGNFDDAQSGVKEIFSDNLFAKKLDSQEVFLSSANSINWGRLLPQIVYYFSAYCEFVNSGNILLGDEIDFCVPTGNFGDILAGWYAKKMGLPIRKLICASNSNNVLTDFINTGIYDRRRKFHTTISPSMDILVSSNLERLLFMLSDAETTADWMDQLKTKGKYNVGGKALAEISKDFDCGCCSDETAKKTINDTFIKDNYLIDPHTANAYAVLSASRKRNQTEVPAIVVSTASPFKFPDSVLEALGKPADIEGDRMIGNLSAITKTPVPRPLENIGNRAVRFEGSISKENMRRLILDFVTEN